MSRLIEFRAWDKISMEMFHVDAIFFDLGGKLKGIKSVISEIENHFILNENLILIQFTGLYLQGKKIYEGDILESDKGVRAKVFYPELQSGFFIQWKNIYHLKKKSHFYKPLIWAVRRNDWKVIGNIYETPELIDA